MATGDKDKKAREREPAAEDLPPAGSADARKGTPGENMTSAVLGLSNLFSQAGADGVSPAVTDAVTQALVLVLGSGPAIAALDGLLTVQAANGIMYHNAVANQQKTNLLGMAMTAKCVRYMLDPNPSRLAEDIIIDETEEEN
jgi:Killing trait